MIFILIMTSIYKYYYFSCNIAIIISGNLLMNTFVRFSTSVISSIVLEKQWFDGNGAGAAGHLNSENLTCSDLLGQFHSRTIIMSSFIDIVFDDY